MSDQIESKYIIVCRLAKHLRKHGSRVLNGSCKMSLATSALCLLNNLFVEVLNEEWLAESKCPPSIAAAVDSDVRFLYDFMKSIPSLKLFHQVQTLRGGVDLSHFSKLTVLELRKIPAHLIIGLDCLSVQLKALICSRSIYLLKEIFGASVNHQSDPIIWTELKELNLSYNYLESLDHSLRYLPNVEVLDLSHNHIKISEEIQVLKMLTFVNLSYNELNHLPVFHVSSCRSLTKLYMRNNNLEDLDGVDCLFNLEELDVGYNLLSEYHALNPLNKLKFLRMLSFEGNPLFFHSQHQLLVANYIHQIALIRGLQLNGKRLCLSSTQSMLSNSNDYVGSNRDNHHQTSINVVVGDGASTMYIPSNLEHLSRSISEISEKSSFEDKSISSLTSQSGTEQIAVGTPKNRRRKSKTGKKVKKTREVLITENEEQDITVPKTLVTTGLETVVPSHMKAKASMEARRQELGESWLIPESAFSRIMLPTPEVPPNNLMSSYPGDCMMPENSFSRIMLPTPQVPSNTPMSSYPGAVQIFSEKELASKVNSSFASQNKQPLESPSQFLTSSPILKEMTEILDINGQGCAVDLEGQISNENDDIEVLSSSCNEKNANFPDSTSKHDFSDGDIYWNNANDASGDQKLEQIEELESEEESEDSIFFVERRDEYKKQAIFVNVGANYIKEKDVITAKVLDRLDLNVLQSLLTVTKEEDGLNIYEVHLEFDTFKTSRQKRIYIFDDLESSKVLSKILQPFADAKTLKEVTLGALECVKCSSQFSKQVANRIVLKTKKPLYGKDILSSSYDSGKEYVQEVNACPNCGNHILLEMESIPMPAMGTSPRVPLSSKKFQKSSDKSPDTVSTGSGSSGNFFSGLFSSMKISPILKKKSVSVAQNSENQGRKESSDLTKCDMNQAPGTDSKMSRNSSDITILSNPSQSSIAVIPDPEINLNTILERDSHSSISPPISQDSIYYKAHNTSEPEGCIENIETDIQNVMHQQEKLSSRNEKDPDYYSFTESSINTSASHFVTTEVTSSESEKYMSPVKSNASQKCDSESPSKTRELDEVSHLLTILGEKRTLTYDTFSEIDHRLKLHLEINIFGKNEQLEACLMTSIVPLSTGEEFPGLCALSSKKLYIIKFLPSYSEIIEQNEPVDKAVRVVHASLLNQISQIDVSLGSQGLTIACSPSHIYTLVIRDADICNSFSSLISDFMQEHQSVCGTVEFLSSADLTLQMIRDSIFSAMAFDEMPEILLHLFAFWWNGLAEEESCIPVCIIVTPDDLFISRILYKKCDSAPDLKNLCVYHYTSVDNQKLSDLISLKLKNNFKSVEVSFLNESSQDNSDSVIWNVKMETKSALFSFISALKNPWEGIFGVPLSLSCEEE